MADFTLSCTDVHFERILIENAEGQVLTSTDTLTASSSDATRIACTLDVMPATNPDGSPNPFAGQPARKLQPLTQPRAGDAPFVVTVADTTNTGVASWVDNVTLAGDEVETQIVGDPGNVVLQPQPLPPA